MEIISRIIFIAVELMFFAFALLLFIQCNKELWDEMGRDSWNELKSDISGWFYNTKFGMWYRNKQNGVTVLSEKEYQKLIRKNNVKTRIIINQKYE